MPITRPMHPSALARAGGAAFAGVAAGAVATVFVAWQFVPLIAWDATALTWTLLIWSAIWPMDSGRTAERAVREDPTRPIADTLLILAAVASLLAVGFVLVHAEHIGGAAHFLDAILAVLSIVLSWVLVHTTFTLRYARMYYTGPDGGVSFNQPDPPAYSDFAYLAFTIGMTFQVSDTNLQSREARSIALRHALLSYLFGTVIVATTINLIASLGK